MPTTTKSRETAAPVRKAAKNTVAAKPDAKGRHKVPASPVPLHSKAAKTDAAPKADKPKKPKLVRDSFTIPRTEYTVLQELKQRAARSGTAAKKSEILRAGIKALAAMGDAAFAAAVRAVPPIKTGRPAAQ
jgi:hypothetical protein